MSSVCQPWAQRAAFSASSARRERDLAQARAVGAHFPDAESGAGILAEIEEDLPGVERQADLADEALAAGQIGGRDDGPLRSRAEVVDVDAVVRKEPVGTGAVVDVRVVVIRRVGLAFDEDDLLEAQRLGIDGRLGRNRIALGRCAHLASKGGLSRGLEYYQGLRWSTGRARPTDAATESLSRIGSWSVSCQNAAFSAIAFSQKISRDGTIAYWLTLIRPPK